MKELEKYKAALQDLKEVSKGGKYWANCSFKDISARADRAKAAKEKLIIALGTREFEKLFPEEKK